MGIALRKVWRDLWNNKWRTLLVVLSITVGVVALGMTTSSDTFLNEQMALSRGLNRSPHARMTFSTFLDDDAVQAVINVPQVVDAEGWITASIRWKPTLEAEWKDSSLLAREFTNQKFDLLELKRGRWARDDEIMVEDSHLVGYGMGGLGSVVYVEANNRALPLTIVGTVRDPAQAPPEFNPINKAAFYVSRNTMERLFGTRNFNNVRFTLDRYDKEKVKQATDAVQEKLKRLGANVTSDTISTAEFQDPDRAVQQEFINGLSLILIVMAFFSMGLSATLVVNTINAIVAQQLTQIGIMKTIGGEWRQIFAIYLAGVIIYGVLSLLIAVPLGMVIGYSMARFWLTAFNVPPLEFRFLPAPIFYQVMMGLITPLAAALVPIFNGVRIPVRQAIAAYGVGTGRYGAGLIDQLMSKIQGMPRMATIALRNTFRRMWRVTLTEITLISAGAIFMMVTTTGFSFDKTFDSIWEAWGCDAIVIFKGFQRTDKLIAAINSHPDVNLVEVWTWQQAKVHKLGVSGSSNDYTIQLRGGPDGAQTLHATLVAGRLLESNDGRAIVMNQKLAADMGVQMGDQVEIDYGGNRKATWMIVGLVFDIGVGGGQNTAFVRQELLNADIHQAGRGTVTLIKTKSNTRATQDAVKKYMENYFAQQKIDVILASGQKENEELSGVIWALVGGLLQTMTLLVAIVGSIGLSGTLSINVMERKREIGVMRAVGASSNDIAFIFMGEGLMLGLLSWVQAIPLSMIAAQYFVKVLGDALKFPFFYIYSYEGVAWWLMIIIVLSIFASWLPARSATQISVQQSLAYE
jgi:putative ABC transport system permease protein